MHRMLQLNILGSLTSSVPQVTITDNPVCECQHLRPFVIFRMGSRLKKFNNEEGEMQLPSRVQLCILRVGGTVT
jgi:hypothetical protein